MSTSVNARNPAVEVLMHQIEKQKFQASYLLTGPDPERRKELARNFAKALNCEEKHLFEACDCVSCKKIECGNHPDVYWYGLDEDENSIKIGKKRIIPLAQIPSIGQKIFR